MDNQGAGTKKIVLKHRSLGAQQGVVDAEATEDQITSDALAAVTNNQSETLAGSAADTTLQYQGEIFDQFYRPLSALGGDARLTELAAEHLVPHDYVSARLESSRATKQIHQQAAEALATQIHNLAQVRRETDVDVYLSAFNVVLATHDCYTAKEILDLANAYFTERYYDEIRERGERPEIFYQIIKRVGAAASDRIKRIVSGLDVADMASRLWNLYHGRFPNRFAMITDVLLDCTEKQVRTLRSEFLVIPYRDIAMQLRSILFEVRSDSKEQGKRTIGRTEATDQRRVQAYRARGQLRAIRYLLLGRSADEVALIKRCFLELDTSDKPDSEKAFDYVVQKMFLHTELDRLGTLFQGWSAEEEANELHKLLYPNATSREIEDTLSDPRDAVDRDFGQGIGPYLKRFKKSRALRDKSDLIHRIHNVFELLDERIAALTPARFIATNDALLERYGYELDPSLFRLFTVFDARSVATVLDERVRCGYDFFEIVKPLEFLGPRDCLAVQKAFACMYGIELRDAIDRRLLAVRDKTSLAEREELYARYIDGRGRWPLAIDLLGRYLGYEEVVTEWSPEFVADQKDEELSIRIAQEIDQEVKQGELDATILPLLLELDQEQLARLERAFFELTEPPLPLQRGLSQILSPEAFGRYQLATFGLRDDVVGALAQDPLMLISLRYMPPSIIKIVRGLFQLEIGEKIDLWLINQFPLVEDEDLLIDLLSIAYTPEAFTFRVAIQETRREVPSHIENLRRFWSRAVVARLGMERAVDRNFPRMRVHVKQAAARHALPPAVLAEMMLSFEGVDPAVTSKILECFDAVDSYSLQEILRENIRDQSIIEEAYDVLFPDAQLRTSIKSMKIDLDVMNEILLHLDGHSAEEVAAEVHALLELCAGAELGERLQELFSPSTDDYVNPRIPLDINWMEEMMYQVGLAYERLYALDMFDAFVAGGVSLETLEMLSGYVFGSEVCSTAQELHQLIVWGQRGEPVPEGTEARLATFLESRGVRHRQRIARAYAAYWARLPDSRDLLSGISAYVRETTAKHKIVALFAALV
jgi:hypothetical protein